jgi:hypothetical protein
MELALEYGYDSSDGFSRAFKMHYGLSPAEYKRLNRRIKSDGNLKQGGGFKMIDYRILEELQCTMNERKQLLPLVDELLELSNKARQLGLYELEKEKNRVSHGLIKKGLELMVDGTDPEVLERIIFNLLICGSKQRRIDLLKGIIILEGVLSIQQGRHPNLIKEILLSYLGVDMIKEFEKYYNSSDEVMSNRIMSYIQELPDQNAKDDKCSVLESPIGKMGDRSLQRLLREIDYEIIAVAVRGSSKRIQEKVLRNVSPRLAVVIIERLNVLSEIEILYISEAQKSIMEVANVLVKQGDIVM